MLRYPVAGLLATFLSPMFALSTGSENLPTLQKDEGFVAIGVPENSQIIFRRGNIENSNFLFDKYLKNGITGESKGNYIIIPLKSTQSNQKYCLYAIITNRRFPLVNGSRLNTFSVESGSIQYLGNIDISNRGNGFEIEFKYNFEEAQIKIPLLFPSSTLKLVPGRLDRVSVDTSRNFSHSEIIRVPVKR